jgi:peptide/nickel transport system substrate-binding protein
VLALCIAFAACTPHRRDPHDPALEVVIATEPETLDPRFVVDAASMRVTRLVHAGLFRLDPDTEEPLDFVAASHRFEDSLTLLVTLRDDVRFHSGAPITAHDVVATIDALKDPSLHAREAHAVAAIERAEAVSDKEVRIRLAHPHATLLTDLEVPILRADQARAPAGTELDGLGPYRVARVRPGAIDLDPAEHSPLPKPAHPVHVRVVHDENARALRLIGGETDVAPSGISPNLLSTFEERGLRVASRPGANLVYVLFRDDQGPFSNVDARRAFGLAIDREQIAKYMLGGRARLATGLLPPGHWASTPRPLRTRDAAKAREILHGTHVKCTLLGSTDRLRVSIARVVAQELAEVGIDAEVIPLELGTLLARLSAGDFDAAILQIPELMEPNVLRVFLHSKWMPPNGANRARVDDRDVDAAIDEGSGTLDLAARRAAYARLEERVLDRAYWIPLWHEDQFAVTSARASSFVLSAEGRWLGLASVP